MNKVPHAARCPGMTFPIQSNPVSVFIVMLSIVAADIVQAGSRIFTDRDGRKIEAEIIAKSDNHVRIRTAGDKEFNVELDKLSESDRNFIRNWEDPQSNRAMARTDIARVMRARGFVGVPFTNENNHLFVRFRIGGKDVTFLLDSGAMTSVVTPEGARSLGLDVSAANVQAAGVGGGARVEGRATADKCRFGESSDVRMDFMVMNLPETGVRIEGLIGSDFFHARQAMLDYAGGMLWLRIGSPEA